MPQRIADDFPAIGRRLAEIEAERLAALNAPAAQPAAETHVPCPICVGHPGHKLCMICAGLGIMRV